MRYISFIMAGVLGLVLLSSCSSPKLAEPSKGAYYKVGNPYRINGKWYYPKEENNYDERGTASWYGPTFHGGKTANGDTFNENSLTAAHKTLPLPSIVRVTNLDNKRTVLLMVNDRGPFVGDRIIDVSKYAADILGFKDKGTARVRVQYIPDQTNRLLASMPQGISRTKEELLASSLPPTLQQPTAPTEAPAQDVSSQFEETSQPTETVQDVTFNDVEQTLTHATKEIPSSSNTPHVIKASNQYIQAGTFSDERNAEKVGSTLQPLGTVNISKVLINGHPLYRVRLGPLPDGTGSAATLQQVVGLGHGDAIIVSD